MAASSGTGCLAAVGAAGSSGFTGGFSCAGLGSPGDNVLAITPPGSGLAGGASVTGAGFDGPGSDVLAMAGAGGGGGLTGSMTFGVTGSGVAGCLARFAAPEPPPPEKKAAQTTAIRTIAAPAAAAR